MNRRSRLEIYMDIMLALADGPKNPTRLMYSTNLSWAPLQECLKSLISQGAVVESERSSNRKVYSLTQKGSSIISRYQEFAKELIPLSDLKLERERDIAMLY
ncbi:MAG: winged helix-turn-helix domain-containing protein [Nitrososphaerales archaeon]